MWTKGLQLETEGRNLVPHSIWGAKYVLDYLNRQLKLIEK